MNEIKKVGFFSKNSIDTAVEHLRVIAPLSFMGIEVIRCIENGRINEIIAQKCDLFVIQRDFSSDYKLFTEVNSLADRLNIPLLLDLDDDLLNLPMDHVDRLTLHYANGLLPLIQSMSQVDAMTVSTEALKHEALQYNNNVYLLPNYLDTKTWIIKKPRMAKQSGHIRGLYMGTITHRPDIELISVALEEIIKKYDQLELVFFGLEPTGNLRRYERVQYVQAKGFDYKEFCSNLNEFEADFAIAPLVDNRFNHSKSPLKFYEYSAIGLSGVYSNAAPYAESVHHLATGLLAENTTEDWVRNLSLMIDEPELRMKLAEQAQHDVIQHYSIGQIAPMWVDAYQTISKRKPDVSQAVVIPAETLQDITEQLDLLYKRNNEKLSFLESEIITYKQQDAKAQADIEQLQIEARKLFDERNEIASQAAKIHTQLDNEISRQSLALEQIQKEMDNRIDELSKSNQTLLVSEEMLNQYRLELVSVYSSHSWKLTRGLRYVMNMIRRILSSTKPESTTQKRDLKIIQQSGFFDEKWYLDQYPDVKKAGAKALEHYYHYGGKEGRNPSKQFDSTYYLDRYPDVREADVNPLAHYLKYGKTEGRTIRSLELSKEGSPEVCQASQSASRFSHVIKRSLQIAREEGMGSLFRRGKQKLSESKQYEKELKLAASEDNYDISIIIPAYNAAAYSKACIEKVYQVGSKHRFEVIVVDNASSDETQAEMEKEIKTRSDFSYYRQEVNLGFGGGVNLGILRSKGKYVVILNNDTLPTADWLDEMVAVLESDPTIGIVSPMTNYVGEGPQLEKTAINIDPFEIDNFAARNKHRGIYYESGRLVFFCVMIRRSVIDQIGLLDEGYIKGNFEDDDYCLRTILSGYKLAIARDAFVYHHGSITFKKNKIVHDEYMELNRKRFFLKTGNVSIALRKPMQRTDNPKVSVIVRTLNRPQLLRKALASLSNQNFRDFEVILINDGGKPVHELVELFEQHFPIRYIENEKSSGRTPALNIGIKNVITPWLAVLDDDDIVYPWHLATLMQQTELFPVDRMFYTNYNRTLFNSINEDKPILLRGVEPWHYDKDYLWVSNRIPMHTWLIARECFEKVGLFDENQDMLEDFEFLVRLSKHFDFKHVDRVTGEYRFYLDGMNSIINQRAKTFEALEYIYSQHPAYNLAIKENRQVELESLKSQITKIDEKKANLNGEAENDRKVIRDITKLILGF